MIPELAKKTSLFNLLYEIDKDLAEQCRKERCPHCNAALHKANYMRQPWEVPDKIDAGKLIRRSLCCSKKGCRHRVQPASCIFLGRHRYWSGAILIITALRQIRPKSYSIDKLMKLFKVSRRTIYRWGKWFREIFPTTAKWKTIRGRISAQVATDQLPGSLLQYFVEHTNCEEKAFVGCLRFLASAITDYNQV